MFITYVYGVGNGKLFAMTITSILTDLVSPFLATLIRDERCLREYFVRPSSINASYSFSECILLSPRGDCAETAITSSVYTFTPQFVYSNQCRNAIFSNFMPIVIYSSVIETFAIPFFYLRVNSQIDSLEDSKNEEGGPNASLYSLFRVIKSFCTPAGLVLSNVGYQLVAIFEDFAQLLVYGIVSPLCAVAIGTGAVVKIYLLRVGIMRYHRLQGVAASMNADHIETLCANALRYADRLMWPAFAASSIFFAFYMWDMANDSDQPEYFAQWILMSITILASFLIIATHHRYYMSIVWEVDLSGARVSLSRKRSSSAFIEIMNARRVVSTESQATSTAATSNPLVEEQNSERQERNVDEDNNKLVVS